MNWLPDIFRRRKIYGDLAEEMRIHLEERTEQLISEGMSRKEAQQAARRAFGNPTVIEAGVPPAEKIPRIRHHRHPDPGHRNRR
jgi:hypothetical protein